MSAQGSSASAPSMAYVRLITYDKKGIILPVPAAMSSKMLCDLLTGLMLQQLHEQARRDPSHAICLEHALPVREGDLGYDYHCYATAYLVSQEDSKDGTNSEHTALLEIPLTCLEFDTVARIAEALVASTTMKATSNTRYYDVLRDLDRGKTEDQMTAIRLILGADFLGC